MSNEGEAFFDNGVKIDRFLLQLMTSEHCPMALDDLRGADALGLDIGEDLVRSCPAVARLAVIIICSAWALCMIELSG